MPNQKKRSGPGLAQLTKREAEIALWVADGFTNAAIAHRLGIQKGTVAAHLASAKIKLCVRNRAQLASVVTLACSQRASAVFSGLLSLRPQDAN